MKKNSVLSDFKYVTLNQLWRFISGPVFLVLIPLYLTPEVQGYWYTIASLSALAVFADMGFSTILLQFAAHEFGSLNFNKRRIAEGDEKNLERLATLFHFAMRWTIKIAIIVFPIILVVGYIILNQNETDVEWLLPWVLYGLASTIAFIASMLLSFIEGCNSVGEAHRIRLFIAVVAGLVTMYFLVSGKDLFALAYSAVISGMLTLALAIYRYKAFIYQLYQTSKKSNYNWSVEIFPLMWRYSISWVSGYFMLQIFTPIAFFYYGPVEAGAVGFSLGVIMAIFGISNIWMILITPKINMHIFDKDRLMINKMFYKHLLLSIATYSFGVLFLFFVISFTGNLFQFLDRLVDPFSLLVLSIAWMLQLIVNSLAIYIRAHKKEPLLVVAVISAIYISVTTLLIATTLPVHYYFFGFLTSYIFAFPWVYIIFKKYTR